MKIQGILLMIGLCAATMNAAPATLLDQGYRQMYDLDFEAAHRTFDQWRREHPADPLGPVSNAASYLFSEFDRLNILQSQFFVDDDTYRGLKKPTADPTIKRKFEADLAAGQKLSADILRNSPEDKDAIFASVLRIGLHADYLALIENRNLQALSEMKAGRALAEKLLALDSHYYDAYLAVGVENYMLSLKPAPARWLLHMSGAQTDKGQGISKLQVVARSGHYLQPFARLLLAVASLRDKNRAGAKDLLAGLARDFPRNRLYAQELAKLQ